LSSDRIKLSEYQAGYRTDWFIYVSINTVLVVTDIREIH
jgi:hypothetical protein